MFRKESAKCSYIQLPKKSDKIDFQKKTIEKCIFMYFQPFSKAN